LLHLEGLAVTSASTAREAIAAARGQIFDIVFTDLGLPDMSGPALLRELAATAQGDPRLVVITGAGEADIMEARRAGAEVVFTKPFEWDLVRTYLQRSTAAR
jgi:two-component system CheB/CheR fusion protein